MSILSIVKLGWDAFRIATGLKGGAELLDYQKSTETKLYNRVYKDEISKILGNAPQSNLSKANFIKYYKKTITKDEVVNRIYETSDGLQAQIEYALEERHLGNYGHMRMHALHWAVKDHKEEYKKLNMEKKSDFLYEKYGEYLYKQYKKRH